MSLPRFRRQLRSATPDIPVAHDHQVGIVGGRGVDPDYSHLTGRPAKRNRR
jgi:hypothetical protein